MKIFSVTIPHMFQYGKNYRKISLNQILNMNWMNRKVLHDNMFEAYKQVLAVIPAIGVGKEDTYRVSLGFYAGKSTKTCDADNFMYIMKVFTDVLKEKLGVDDSIFRIPEQRIVFLGRKENEQLIAQLELIDVIVQPIVENINV